MTIIIRCLILLLSLSTLASATVSVVRFPSGTPVKVCQPFDTDPSCGGGGGGGSGNVGIGTAGWNAYYATNGSTVTASSAIFTNPSGNVGIGSLSPQAPLDVKGQLRLDTNMFTGSGKITFDNTGSPAQVGVLDISNQTSVSGGFRVFGIDADINPLTVDSSSYIALQMGTNYNLASTTDKSFIFFTDASGNVNIIDSTHDLKIGLFSDNFQIGVDGANTRVLNQENSFESEPSFNSTNGGNLTVNDHAALTDNISTSYDGNGGTVTIVNSASMESNPNVADNTSVTNRRGLWYHDYFDSGGPGKGHILNSTVLDVENQKTNNGEIVVHSALTSGPNRYFIQEVGGAKSSFTGNVGIGTSTPQASLSILGGNLHVGGDTDPSGGVIQNFTEADQSQALIGAYDANAGDPFGSPIFFGLRSRGTVAIPGDTQDGDAFFNFSATGFASGGIAAPGGAFGTSLSFTQDGATGANYTPGSFHFFTTDPSGNFAERVTIRSAGNVGINTANPGELLDVNGDARILGKLTVTGAIDPTYLDLVQQSTPSNPASSHNRLYFKSDNNIYMLNSSGTETQINGSGGGTPGGSNKQIQYNNSSSFGGATNFIFDGTNVGIGTALPSSLLEVGTQQFNVTTGGNVGISSTAPTAYLDINGTNTGNRIGAAIRQSSNSISSPGLYINNNGANGILTQMIQNLNTRFSFADTGIAGLGGVITDMTTGKGAKVILDSNGNLGIGTWQPTTAFAIAQSNSEKFNVTVGGFMNQVHGITNTGAYTQGDSSINKFFGNVGIGSSLPGTLLDVQGNPRASNGVYLSFQSIAPTVATNDCGTLTQGTIQSSPTPTDEAFTINSGTVSIGTLTACSATFGQSHTSPPQTCVCNDQSPLAVAATFTSTKVTCTALTTLAGATIDVLCKWTDK